MPTTTRRGTIYEGQFTSRVNGVDALIIVRLINKVARLFPTYSVFSINDDKGRLPESPLNIRVVDNDENPFAPIKGKEATFNFFSSNAVSLSTFMNGGSDEWLMVCYTGSVADAYILFQGYVVLDVASEPLYVHPYVVTLRATDNIGILKNKPLVDFNGLNPKDDNKIISYIAWALNQTGLQLPIYVNNNLFEENNPDVPFYESCYLHATTFEKEQTSTGAVSEDCYTVLQKILGNDSRIMQQGGAWWIERIYEKRDLANTVHQFDYDGTYVGSASPTFYLQPIDLRGDVDLVNDSTNVTIQSPYKSLSLRYNLDFPNEIIPNIDFTRGAVNNSLDQSPVVIDGVTYYQSKSNIDDWTALEGASGIPGTGSPSSTNNYIRRLFSDVNKTYEVERYVVIEHTLAGGTFFDKSKKLPVKKNDKIDISVDVKFSSDVFASSGAYRFNTIQVRLYGNDGTFYTLNGGTSVDPTPIWRVTSGSFASNNRYFVIEGDLSEDMTDWKTCTWITNSTNPNPCPPIPKDGSIEVLIIHDQNSSFQTDRYFNNLRFTYIPFINGSYSKYAAQSNTVTQAGSATTEYYRTIENQLYISDAPNPNMKGALKIFDGTNYVLAGRFYDGMAFPGGVPADEFLHPYSYQLLFAVWQQYRKFIRNIEGDFLGLKPFSPPLIPDMHKQFYFTNPNQHVNNKYFMLLKAEQDFDTQVWRFFLWECYDSVNGLVFFDDYEFKYITG